MSNQLLREAQKLFELGRYEELKKLLVNAIYEENQRDFEMYIKKGSFCNNSLKPCAYGNLNGQQVFTNYKSLYIMNKPFVLKRDFVGSINDKNSIAPIELPSEKLVRLIDRMDKIYNYGAEAYVNEDAIGDRTFTIWTEFNEVAFDSELIFEIFRFLGYKTKFKLSNTNPMLIGESSKGKGYVLGLRKKPSLEVRRFNLKDKWEE